MGYGGNPWADAAGSYQHGLDNLMQINQQGYQAQAAAPASIYDRFVQGYQMKKEEEARAQAEALKQQQYERQMMLAQETLRHNQSVESFNQSRLVKQDENADQKRVLDFLQNVVDPTFTGNPQEVEALLRLGNAGGIPEEALRGYFDARKTPGSPAQTLSVDSPNRFPVPDGSEAPPESWSFSTPAIPDTYQRGTQYGIKQDALDEANRAHIETEKIRTRSEERLAAIAAETARHNAAMEGISAARLNKSEKALTLEDATPEERRLVDMIGTYKGLPEKILGRGADRTRIMAMVAQAYPGWEAGTAAQNYKFLQDLASTRPGTAGGIVGSTNRMLEHADELHNIIQESGGGKGWVGKIDNIAKYPLQMMSGNEERFNAVRDKLLSETEKLVSSGVPHVEQMRRDVQNLKFTDPIDKKQKVLSAIVDIGLAQTHSLEEQRRNVLRDRDPGTALASPESIKRVNKLYRAIGRPEISEPPQTSGGYSGNADGSPLNPTSRPDGTVKMQFPDGKTKYVPVSERGKWKLYGGKEIE